MTKKYQTTSPAFVVLIKKKGESYLETAAKETVFQEQLQK